MTAPDEVKGFFIAPGVDSPPGAPRMAAVKITLVKNSILPIAKDIVAILDTASVANIVDEHLAAENNLEFIRDQNFISGGQFVSTKRIYKCGFFLEEFKQLINSECGTSPFKERGRNYLVILGMNFIRNFDLEIKSDEREILLRRSTQ
jgi:hypothetical protein